MKRTLSVMLVIALIACLGLSVAFAEPVIVPESPNAPVVVPGSGSAVGGNSYNDSPIVPIDPNTNKPVRTPTPEYTPYVSTTAPIITKNPSGESIEAGDSVVFVAYASDAMNVEWFLTDGTTTILASEVGSHFPGVTATGTNSERLVLSNVSDKMDGWSAMARFDNAIGASWTQQAKISVTPDPNAVPSPTPTPLPTATPSVTPTPVPANVAGGTNGTTGTPTQHGTGENAPNGANVTTSNGIGNSDNTQIGTTTGDNIGSTTGIVTTGTAGSTSGGTARNSHVGAYILAALAGIVIVGSVLVMALYMKGKISLGKFEKFLGSFGNDSDAEMFDNDGEFYNPDDFKDVKDSKNTKEKK